MRLRSTCLQELALHLNEDNVHPALSKATYRTAPDPTKQGEMTPYGNPKFQQLVHHVFRSKRGVLTPADLAFVEVALAASLCHCTLAAFSNAVHFYRKALVFAKENMGRHFAIQEPGLRPLAITIGARYVRVQCARSFPHPRHI